MEKDHGSSNGLVLSTHNHFHLAFGSYYDTGNPEFIPKTNSASNSGQGSIFLFAIMVRE